jgi:putative hydrolase of the HAD superfamily
MNAIRQERPAGPVRAVFFDAGFTLIFPSRPVVDLYVECARSVSEGHCDVKLKEAFARAWAAGTRADPGDHRSSDALERARWHQFTLRVAREIPELLPHHDAWLAALEGTFDSGDGWRLVPHAPALLRELRARGKKIAIVSNWHAGLHRIVSAVGLDDLVDFVVCSADVGFRKPHPEIFHVALRQGGVPPSAVVHVGDTWEEDVLGAQAVGIEAVHLTSSPMPVRGPAKHHTIADLSEIAGLV